MKELKINQSEMTKEFSKVKDPELFIDLLLEYLHRYSSDKYLEHLKSIIPGLPKSYGTPVPVLKALAARAGEFIRRDLPLGVLLMQKLWNRGSREERRVASEALPDLFKTAPIKAHRLVMTWMPDLKNWEECDALAINGYRDYSTENLHTTLRHSASLVKSPNRWVRRFGLVSLIPLVPLLSSEGLGPFLVILKPVMTDPDENVMKGASWLLREMSTRDRFRVEKFLDYHTRDGSAATRFIVREGSRKLPEDRRRLLMEKLNR